MLEGSPHPCGQLPLELAVTKGWDARVVDVVQKTYPKAAETLDPVKVPGGILKKAFPPPGKGLPDQEFLNDLGGPEVLSNDIKGATVAVLALSGWNKDKQPTTPKGMRWVRKAAEECRPLPKLEVVMLLAKPDPKNLENGWSDGREVQRLLEEKLHKKACKDAKNASKRAKKVRARARFEVFRANFAMRWCPRDDGGWSCDFAASRCNRKGAGPCPSSPGSPCPSTP